MSAAMKTCPQCGAEHKLRIARCGCGHEWVKRGETEPAHDPLRGCCSYTAGALRCHYPGGFGGSVKGGGRLYCREHAAGVDADTGALIVERSHREYPEPDWSPAGVKARAVERVKEEAAALRHASAPRHAGGAGRGWALNILDRIERGERVPLIAEQFAREVAGDQHNGGRYGNTEG